VSHLVYQREVTHEELGVESELQELCGQHNIKTHEVWGATLYHLQVVTYSSLKTQEDLTASAQHKSLIFLSVYLLRLFR
jgi:hypothetical protein